MRISAIISVYNGERFLSRCLEGIRSQTRAVDEVVVIDDGSTDGSERLVKAAGLPNLVYKRIPNSGTALVRVEGLRTATGDLVDFFNRNQIVHASVLVRRDHLLNALASEIDFQRCIDIDYSVWLRCWNWCRDLTSSRSH